jgi:hypothetical protein
VRGWFIHREDHKVFTLRTQRKIILKSCDYPNTSTALSVRPKGSAGFDNTKNSNKKNLLFVEVFSLLLNYDSTRGTENLEYNQKICIRF